ncbi:MAG: amidase [candidate division KSB1 bacterium]|nr:amidase [candidate division KSB1 bacterium]
MRWLFMFSLVFMGLSQQIALAQQEEREEPVIKAEMVKQAEKLIGLEFTDAEIDSMLDGLNRNLRSYQALRKVSLDNSVPPALLFNPIPKGKKLETRQKPIRWSKVNAPEAPDDLEKLAYASVAELAELIRTRKITSVQLTQMYLNRLKKYGPKLQCVVTLTEELAMEQARRADAEIAAGKYRGPLHGIPYGAKDLLAVKGYKTTWGAMPYKDQIIDQTATVVKKLEEAGAVLVAKLTLGALAWGDVWFGGKTRNPWNLEQGSSGSSAGSAAATAAGLVAFSIGTETWGSIVSPSTRCGVTGLRPTFGRVSRAGAMALSWSMDKIGPIARTVEDCAIVFEAIRGPDGIDQTVVEVPFNYDPNVKFSELRIGYTKSLFERDYRGKGNDAKTLETLRKLGAKLIPIELPDTYPVRSLSFILSAEAAAAFDELTRSNRDDLLVRQIKNAWPNVFRTSRFIPAVEYIQANRIRTLVIEELDRLFEAIDLYVVPSFGGNNLLMTNLTGHPCVVVPNGFDDKGSPTSISFIGDLFDEATVLAVAKAVQDATDFHRKHPPLFP